MGGRRINLIGHRFGKLNVIECAGSKYGKPAWLCRCDCGAEKIIGGYSLRAGRTLSCGCYRKQRMSERHNEEREDLVGKMFGRLKVIRFYGVKNQTAYWLCKCSCGSIKPVRDYTLKVGLTTSCGCYCKEVVSEMFKGRTDYCGSNNPNYKVTKTDIERQSDRSYPEYKEWRIKVFKRDRYACQFSGCLSKYIQAHHIEDYGNNPELRIVLVNGICLCKYHHRSFHSMYGVKVSTREQLEQFLYKGA